MKKIILFICLVLGVLSMSGCSNEKIGPYGKYIEEDFSKPKIIDDNYRNYYEIFVSSFRDSDGDGHGDLKGVIEKLDYISDLGFTGIWLMPINESPSYHKYDIKDYFNVDREYGTLDDLKLLINECHKRDIKLILDLVLNHSSNMHPKFIASVNAYQKKLAGMSLNDEEKDLVDYYVFSKTSKKGFAQVPGKSFYYECNFSDNMPEFNIDNLAVKADFQKIIKFYLDMGVDGFRLDAVKYYYLDNDNKNIEFLSELNSWIKAINKNAYVVGELFDLDTSKIKKYYTSGIDSFFNFDTSVVNPNSYVLNSMNLNGIFCESYYEGQLDNIEIANNYIPAPFLDNHDMSRFSAKKTTAKTKFRYALLQLLNGSSFTYYGDEVGLVGSNVKPNPDQNVRIPILWGEDNKKGNCKSPNGTTVTEYPHETVSVQLKQTNSLLNYYKKVLLIRNQNPEIARGTVEMLNDDADTGRLVLKKTYNEKSIGIIINFSMQDDIVIKFKDYGFNEVTGQLVVDQSLEKYIGLQDDGSIKLPPFSIAIVR